MTNPKTNGQGAPSGAPYKLEVDNLSIEFQSRKKSIVALQGINLNIEANEIVSIVGASGCGKSTLLRSIGGLIPPTSGAIRVDGRLVEGPGADRGMVFQSYSLYPWLSVEKNVAFGLKLRRMPEAMIAERVAHLLNVVGLYDRRKSYPSELSGGMQQRVAIARVLVNDPSIVLLDEPFGALDANTKDRMHTFLRDVWHETQTTFLLVTHDVEEAVFISNRICMMASNPGRVGGMVDVDLPDDRSADLKFAPEFAELRHTVHDFINSEVALND